MSNLIGQSLGRYHILEQLGEGGMATVYKAYDTRLETDVAVKVIRTEKFTPEVLERALKRFEREAKALARLTHPNIVKVTDYGEYEGSPYLVMPFLPGGNLKQYLREHGHLPWQEAARLLLPIAQALEFAHSQGVVHRDVKPSNILLTQNGQPMLTDFGVAKVVEEEATVDLTGTSMTVGTPEYMAPEQTGKNIDHRVDIYALGIVFYEMITGRRPFEADTPLAVLVKLSSDPLPRPGQFASGLPDNVDKVLLKALAKKPDDRYQTMGEFTAAMERTLSSEQLPPLSKVEGSVSGKKEGNEKVEVMRAEKKKAAEQSTPPKPQSPVRNQQLTIKRWLPAGILVVLLGVSLAVGNDLLSMGKRGLGPLAGLATKTATPTFTPTNTHARTPTPTVTLILPPTSTPMLTMPSVVKINFVVSAKLGWQSANYSIQEGQLVIITVISGEWTHWKGVAPYNTGEGGNYTCALAMPASRCVEPLPSFPAGGLIGRIGEQVFGIGKGTTVTATQSGILSFRINDGDNGLTDNDGELNLTIVIK